MTWVLSFYAVAAFVAATAIGIVFCVIGFDARADGRIISDEMKKCTPKHWTCSNQTDNPCGLCSVCLKKASKNFWDFVNSKKQARFEPPTLEEILSARSERSGTAPD